MNESKPLGLYIHIPFCRQKCGYCDFYSLSGSDERMDAYCKALIAHLTETAPQAAKHSVDTVYFGGGTPSLLGEKRLREILKCIDKRYRVTKDAEITLEANPDSANDWRALRALRKAGFNRISLGMQSADDAELREIGRIHTMDQVRQAVDAARKARFDNLSLDLIYGLPHQTLEGWRRNLEAAVALTPQHLSCYGLKVEEGTPLYARRETAGLPGDEEQAEMYLAAVETARRFGFFQYEISNFARPGFASRHNLKYWHMDEYAGFGPGAHSDLGGVRFAYVRDIDRYIAGQLLLSESETEETLARDFEYVMLSLRTAEGIDRAYFERTYRQRFAPLDALFRQYETAGLAQPTEKGWRLTPRGFLVSNSIIVALEDALAAQKLRRKTAAASGDYRIV